MTSGPLRILMSCCVPRRREGGAAAIIYNLSSELERRGHSVRHLFQEDLINPHEVATRFAELSFSLRLGKYIAEHRGEFDIVNLHAPVGFPYGLRRRFSRAGGYPPYVMTLHVLEERRIHVVSREVRKGWAWHFS